MLANNKQKDNIIFEDKKRPHFYEGFLKFLAIIIYFSRESILLKGILIVSS